MLDNIFCKRWVAEFSMYSPSMCIQHVIRKTYQTMSLEVFVPIADIRKTTSRAPVIKETHQVMFFWHILFLDASSRTQSGNKPRIWWKIIRYALAFQIYLFKTLLLYDIVISLQNGLHIFTLYLLYFCWMFYLWKQWMPCCNYHF